MTVSKAESATTRTEVDAGLREEVRQNVRAFVAQEVEPVARELDAQNVPIPDDLIQKMGKLGYLGILFPEEYGGLGLDTQTMAIVAEELSRGWLSVGSVMTRNIITGSLVLNGGTEAQREEWIPRLASGSLLSAAAFTEPNAGSDLGAAKVKATRTDDGYLLNGEKTWCTMALQAGVLTVLARTDPDMSKKTKGLSLFLVPKPAGSFDEPRLTGGHIPVIGYHGLKSYSIAFSDQPVPEENLIGGKENEGFKQLLSTFETARIQTAARAVGVAQAAFDSALAYAKERQQFGRPISEFQVIRHKLAEMRSRIEAARQLTYHAATMKDTGKRCDMEAGMAKVIATEMVEYVTREALQIWGGYGYSTENDPQRFWRDGKLFSLFEGTTEVQLEVIGRRLLED
jgi:alkylation response protein AidB-like acyl-CoA dehydrogenase